MAAKRLSLFAVTLLAAGVGESPDKMAADSLSRDLQRVPADASGALDKVTPVSAI